MDGVVCRTFCLEWRKEDIMADLVKLYSSSKCTVHLSE